MWFPIETEAQLNPYNASGGGWQRIGKGRLHHTKQGGNERIETCNIMLGKGWKDMRLART